jgi:hypothetical protein
MAGKKKTEFNEFLTVLKKKCKQLGIPIRVIGKNQCPSCEYDGTADLKGAKKVAKYWAWKRAFKTGEFLADGCISRKPNR